VRSALILLLSLWVFNPAFGEQGSGSAAQLIRESTLKKDPDSEAASLGRLPKGTIMTLRGDQQNGYVDVEVELEEGTSIDGWVLQKDLNRRARGEDAEEEGDEKLRVEDGEEKVKRIRPRSKIKVPTDESLLLHREATFFYGIQLGLNYGILQSPTTDYLGIGYIAGAHLGFFLDKSIPLRFELGYKQAAGASDTDVVIQVGYFDMSSSIGYLIDRFEFFGTISFLYGASNSDLPTDIVIDTTGDFSSLYGGGGIGYTFPIGEVTDLTARARYLISFNADPLANQMFAIMLYFSFRG